MHPSGGGVPVAQSEKKTPSSSGQSCLKCGDKCRGGYIPHLWKKQCINCGCAYDSHCTQQNVGGFTVHDNDIIPRGDKRRLDLKYAWYPNGVDYKVVEVYMASLPQNCVPLRGSKTEQERLKRITHQHPHHDSNIEYCHVMPDIEKKRMIKFAERRKKKFSGIGKVLILSAGGEKSCHGCSKSIGQDSAYIVAEERIGPERVWHPNCFRCSTCVELLVDLVYFYSPESDKIYCGRHHGETIVSRCEGCDELIYSGTYTEAKGKSWHKHHFTCDLCDIQLHGKSYKEENETKYCENCFDKFEAVKCQVCKESIGIGSKKVTKGEYSWHLECFICKRCRVKLFGSKYYFKDGELICSECKSSEAIAQCQGCKLAISSTVSCLSHKNRYWHSECFKCIVCNTWLANGEFHEMDDNLMCNPCFINKVSKKCDVCQLAITSKGVQFGLKTYHSSCFSCIQCNKKFTSEEKVKEKDGQPLCLDCYIQMAKKCFCCRGPITSRHTLYNGRPFHLECFKCNICGSSIQNAEFFETSLGEILCMKCAAIK